MKVPRFSNVRRWRSAEAYLPATRPRWRIIGEFREGTLDRVPVWMDKGGRTMLVIYMAVRDESGEYMGTMELVQDMEFAKEHFSK